MNIKQQLRHYLATREMSAADLARKAEVPRQTICNWLSGMPPRNFDSLRKVCLVLNISIDELCFGGCSNNVSKVATVKRQDQKTIIPETLILPIGESVSGLFEVRIKRIK